MQLKEAIIDYLLEDAPTLQQGLALLGVAGTAPVLFHNASMQRTPVFTPLIIQHFRELLLHDAVPEQKALVLDTPAPAPAVHIARHTFRPAPHPERVEIEDDDPIINATDISRLSIELSNLYKLRSTTANRKHDATTNEQRAEIYAECEKIQDQIVFKKKLIEQLKKGEPIEHIETEDDLKLDRLPDNPLELMKLQQNLRTYRSRYAKKLDMYPEGHPNHLPNKQLYSRYVRKLDLVDAKLKAAV